MKLTSIDYTRRGVSLTHENVTANSYGNSDSFLETLPAVTKFHRINETFRPLSIVVERIEEFRKSFEITARDRINVCEQEERISNLQASQCTDWSHYKRKGIHYLTDDRDNVLESSDPELYTYPKTFPLKTTTFTLRVSLLTIIWYYIILSLTPLPAPSPWIQTKAIEIFIGIYLKRITLIPRIKSCQRTLILFETLFVIDYVNFPYLGNRRFIKMLTVSKKLSSQVSKAWDQNVSFVFTWHK